MSARAETVAGFAAVVIAAAVLCSVASGGGGGRFDVDDVVRETQAQRRRVMVDLIDAERREVARGLAMVGGDERRSTEDRASAILLLGRLPVRESIEFCLANLGLSFPIGVIVNLDDAERRFPCRYALASMGPGVVVDVMKWAQQGKRSQEELRHAAWVVTRALGQPFVTGRSKALACVESLVFVGDEPRSLLPLLQELGRPADAE